MEAEKLAIKFKDINFDLIFSSDLMRAIRTAEIIAFERKLAIQATEVLRERYYGKLEGKEYKAVETYRQLLSKLKAEDLQVKENNEIEDDESIIARVITFLRETAITNPKKTILVVTHGGIIRTFLSHLGYSTDYGAVANLGFIKLETDGVDFFVKQMEGIKLKTL